ncbi:hypothetical protein D9M69_532750 [compost metagenome]
MHPADRRHWLYRPSLQENGRIAWSSRSGAAIRSERCAGDGRRVEWPTDRESCSPGRHQLCGAYRRDRLLQGQRDWHGQFAEGTGKPEKKPDQRSDRQQCQRVWQLQRIAHFRRPGPRSGQPLRHEQAGHGTHGPHLFGQPAPDFGPAVQLHRPGPGAWLPDPEAGGPLCPTGPPDRVGQPARGARVQ